MFNASNVRLLVCSISSYHLQYALIFGIMQVGPIRFFSFFIRWNCYSMFHLFPQRCQSLVFLRFLNIFVKFKKFISFQLDWLIIVEITQNIVRKATVIRDFLFQIDFRLLSRLSKFQFYLGWNFVRQKN